MMDEGMEQYFKDMAETALNSCELMLTQNRKAKAQEYYTTALYFSAKVDADRFSIDFNNRLALLRTKVYL